MNRKRMNILKKVKKGTAGYISYEKRRRFLVTAILLLIPIAIYVSGWIYHGKKENLLTVVACVGCLPACKSIVGLIMIWMQKPIAKDRYEQAEKAKGNLTGGYELVFTGYEKTIPVEALIVCGDQIVCYTPQQKADAAYLEKHISKIMADNGYRTVQVRVMKEFKQYLQRVDTIRKKQDHYREGITFTPDERYPQLSREEVIYHTLLAIAL